MKRAEILFNRVKYESERDSLPTNLRKDIIASMLYEAEKVHGISGNEACLFMHDKKNGWMYGNVFVGTA